LHITKETSSSVFAGLSSRTLLIMQSGKVTYAIYPLRNNLNLGISLTVKYKYKSCCNLRMGCQRHSWQL